MIKIDVAAAVACGIVVCSGVAMAGQDDTSLPSGSPPPLYEKMRKLDQGNLTKTVTGLNLRIVTQRHVALRLGTQGGLWWRTKEINRMVDSRARDLDIFFNFAPLMLRPNILPPVVSEIENDVRLKDSGRELRQTQATYRIIKSARFVTVTPLWRDWIEWSAPEPDFSTVPKAILPKNSDERKRWRHAIKEGWKIGEDQADIHFRKNLRLLKRDYLGMLLFLQLEREGFVSMPQVGTGRFGIRVGNRTLKNGVNIFRITVPSRFNRDLTKWKAPVVEEPSSVSTIGH